MSEMAMRANTASFPSLRDRVVFISGGGSGIGAALVEHFVAQHAKVAFSDIDKAAGEALITKLAGATHKPTFVISDVRDIAGYQAALKTTIGTTVLR